MIILHRILYIERRRWVKMSNCFSYLPNGPFWEKIFLFGGSFLAILGFFLLRHFKITIDGDEDGSH